MIKSIKLANSYPTNAVGFVAKDLSNLYNLGFKLDFSTVILNSLFEELLRDNSINNKIDSLIQDLNKNSLSHDIKERCESIRKAILSCTFKESLNEHLNDAYETLSWGTNSSAKDLLSEPQHRVDIIASPDYITKPIIYFGINQEKVKEKIKEIYAEFFSYKEVVYRINSNIDHKFSISLVIKKNETVAASAFTYLNKKTNLINIYVFPGKINITDILQPDEEIKPDYYEVNRDTLKLKTSFAGKQKFKNIVDNGEYKRVECQINNFILDDNVAVELARLTKKASVLLEKEVQLIFAITSNKLEIEHVSNILDLQEEYSKKSQEIIKEDSDNGIKPIIEEELEEINNDPDIEETHNNFEPETELNNEVSIEEKQEIIEEHPQEEQEINNEENNTPKEIINQEPQPNLNEMINSDRPLSELMQEEITPEPNHSEVQETAPTQEYHEQAPQFNSEPIQDNNEEETHYEPSPIIEPVEEDVVDVNETPVEEEQKLEPEVNNNNTPEEPQQITEQDNENIIDHSTELNKPENISETNILDSNPINILDNTEDNKEEDSDEDKKDDDEFIL